MFNPLSANDDAESLAAAVVPRTGKIIKNSLRVF